MGLFLMARESPRTRFITVSERLARESIVRGRSSKQCMSADPMCHFPDIESISVIYMLCESVNLP